MLLAGAGTIVTLLKLPALVLAAPWALAMSLVATSLFVAREARKRIGTAGLDPGTERRIVELAVASGGRVTTTGVAYALSIPLREADAALTGLCRAGYLGVETRGASSLLVYVFPEIDAGLVRATAPSALSRAGTDHLTAAGANRGGAVGLVRVGSKNKGTAAILAICGGSVGAHRFYVGETLAGIVHLLLFWTFLPALAGFCAGVRYLLMTDHAFDVKYNTRLT